LKKGSSALRRVQNLRSPFDRQIEASLKIRTQIKLLEMDLKTQDWESAQKHWDLFDYSGFRFKSLDGPMKELRNVKQTIENIKKSRPTKASYGN